MLYSQRGGRFIDNFRIHPRNDIKAVANFPFTRISADHRTEAEYIFYILVFLRWIHDG